MSPAPRIPASIGVAVALLGCGSPGRNVPVDVPGARPTTSAEEVRRDVGRLLSSDPEASRTAAGRLATLDASGRSALEDFAATVPAERDPRWLAVLEGHGLLPALTPTERLAFLLWEARRPDAVAPMKAQGGLQALAREEPELVGGWLRAAADVPPGDPRERELEAVAVAAGVARAEPLVPALVEVYRRAPTTERRRLAAEALSLVAGTDRRPRVEGSPGEIEGDAEAILRWHRNAGGAR